MANSDYPGDIPQLKRRQEINGQGSVPTGIALTPDQQEAQRRQADRKRMAENIQQSKASIGNAVDTAAGSIASIPKAIGRAIGNTTFDSNLPDWRSESQRELAGRPTARQQAGGIMAFDVAQRAADAGIGYDKQMRAMPRPTTPIPETLKAPGGGMVAAGGAGGQAVTQASQQPVTQSNEQQPERGQFNEVGYGGIVGRLGANGVPTFSNLPQDVQGAGPQRAVGRVGDGIGGGITVGEAGDSQLAMDRFERANAERGRMVEVQREMDSVRGLTGVRGITEGLSSDPLKARRQIREAEIRQGDEGLAAARSEIRQRGIEAGMDRSLRERELTATEQRNQLEGQRTQQEIEAGDMTLAQQRRVEELSAQIADPNTDATEREALLRTYSQLTGKKLDSGTIKLKRASADPLTGAKTEEEYLADARTGRPLIEQGGQGNAAISANQQAIAIRDNPQLSREQKVAQLKALGYN